MYTHKLYQHIGRTANYNNNIIYNTDNFYSLFNSFLKKKNSNTYTEKLPETIVENNLSSTLINFKDVNKLDSITELRLLKIEPFYNGFFFKLFESYNNHINFFKLRRLI